jgi:hypothetical protein
MDQLEHRSRVRITWRFWVAVEGVDDFPRLRFGNISTEGVYFETDRDIGDPGTVQWLHLAASEQGTPVEVMGRVLRLTRDARQSAGPDKRLDKKGVAVEFMPEDDHTRAALTQLVREVATLKMQEEEGGVPGLSPSEEPVPRVQRVQLETTLSMSVGQIVRLTIQTDEGDGTVQIRGRVGQVMPMTRLGEGIISRVNIEVIDGLASEGVHAEPTHETTTVDLRFNDLVAVPDDVDEEDRSSSGDLMGHLSRVKLPSLLSFLERSRLSGELRLENDAGRTASVFIDQGRILDVEAEPPYATPRAALARVVKWTDGQFHFVAGEVEREDRLQLSGKLLSR